MTADLHWMNLIGGIDCHRMQYRIHELMFGLKVLTAGKVKF